MVKKNKITKVEFIFALLPVFLWMAVIFYFSTRQRIVISTELTVNFLFFKMLHVIEYAVLFVLFVRFHRKAFMISSAEAYLRSFLYTFCFGLTDEWHQLFVPTREGRLRDGIIDAFGAGIAWILLAYILPRLPKKLRHLALRLGVY